jgi:hypothetical protein
MLLGLERILVAGLTAGIALPITFVGLRGMGLSWPVAGSIATIATGACALGWVRRLPPELDGVRLRRPWWCAAWLLLSLIALTQTARLSSFMLDPGRPQHSILPNDPWYVRHCCLTAYTESARLAQAGDPNLYRKDHYVDAQGEYRFLGRFRVDPYHYPPPFLLVPGVVRAAAGADFLAVRSVWFGISGLTLLTALVLVAQRLEPGARIRAIALIPAIWVSLPAMLGLQMSNFQVLVVSISVLALVAFPRFPAVGGALLGLAAVSKLFPGILFVYLLASRKWREAAWTAGFAVVFCLLAWVLLGPAPFRAFIEYELPRLASGEAFARPFSRAFPVAANMSAFGIALKLQWLGVPGMSLGVGRGFSSIYALAVLALVIRVGRRPLRTPGEEVAVWLAMLSLGTLASPFAPATYVLLSLVWLLCVDRSVVARTASLVAAWVALSAPLLIPREGPSPSPYLVVLLGHLPAQALALAVPALVLYRAGSQRAPLVGTVLGSRA